MCVLPVTIVSFLHRIYQYNHSLSDFLDRQRVLAMLFLLSVITFIDRVCISLAGLRVQLQANVSPNR